MEKRQADLLGEAPDGTMVQIEFQSTNDRDIALRMAEHYVDIYRRRSQFTRQTVLYVGNAPMQMPTGLGPDNWFGYRLVDARELDGEELLDSPGLGDNILAVLTRLRDRKAAIRRVLEKIAELDPSKQGDALWHLMLMAGLRRMGNEVEEEVKKMPILDDIMDHEVLGREYRRGRKEGEVEMFRRQLEIEFGPLPEGITEKIAARPSDHIARLMNMLIKGVTLEDILVRLEPSNPLI